MPLVVFETGDYPNEWWVCAATGRRANRLYRVRAGKPPAVLWLLLLLGVVPYLLVRLLAYHPVTGYVPFADEGMEARRQRRWRLTRIWGATIAFMLAYVVLAYAPLVIAEFYLFFYYAFYAGVIVLPGAVFVALVLSVSSGGADRIKARALANGRLVELRNVDSAFVRAVTSGSGTATRSLSGAMPPPPDQQPPPGWWWDGARWQPPGRVGTGPD